MAARLEAASREVNYREFEGLDHSLDSAEARAEMLTTIGHFLDEKLQQE